MGEIEPVVAASHELYRRTRRLRLRLALVSVVLAVAVFAAAIWLLRSSDVESALMFVPGVAVAVVAVGYRLLSIWLPKHRASVRWFDDLERDYGVSREEILKISLGLEDHDRYRIDGPVSF